MDNEYKYNAYQYGDTSNTKSEETSQESVQEADQDVVNTEEQSSVNFIMRSPEPEETNDEENKAAEEPEVEPAHSQTSSHDSVYSYSYTKAEKTEKPKKKSRSVKKWVLCVSMAIVFGIVASAVFQASNRLIDNVFGEKDTSDKTVSTTQITANTDKELTDVAQVAANVMPSVVSITNLSVQEVQNFFFGGTTTQESESTGSGIIVGQNDTELLIVSNNHVVEGSSSLTVSFVDGTSVEAQIKGTDGDIDLAIIAVPLSSIESTTLDAIKVATLGDSDALVVGEPTIAIGNALGYGQSVTTGIVSALDRQIEGFDAELIQTDAAINPGNSGGALLNANGEVIGINTAKVNADAVEGMGYAIPISDVNDIINDLMNRETRVKVDENEQGAIGIKGVSVDENTAQIYGMPQGVHVSEVIKGGAADEAGIPKGCIITKFDGTSIDDMDDLVGQLEYYKAGETVEVVVKIPGENGEYVEKTYDVTLSKQSILN